jgi:hypothetical protein
VLFNSDLPESIRVPVFFVSGWFGSDRPVRINYLHLSLYLLFIFRNAPVTRSTAVLGHPTPGPPMLTVPCWPPRFGHPMNERIAATSEVQSLACLRLPKQQNTQASRDEQGRAGPREAAKARKIRLNPSNRPIIHNLLIMGAIENGSGLWQTTRMKPELKFPQHLEDRKVMKLMERIESKQTLARSTQEASPAPKPRQRLAS